MRVLRRNVAAVFCAAILCCAFSQPTTKPLTEDQKIAMLIKTVERLKDATFIRNGTEHDCHAAAKHMRDKWDHRKEYLIRFKDGREVESGAFLQRELKKIESGDSPPSR
jgi:hypothetical protein